MQPKACRHLTCQAAHARVNAHVNGAACGGNRAYFHKRRHRPASQDRRRHGQTSTTATGRAATSIRLLVICKSAMGIPDTLASCLCAVWNSKTKRLDRQGISQTKAKVAFVDVKRETCKFLQKNSTTTFPSVLFILLLFSSPGLLSLPHYPFCMRHRPTVQPTAKPNPNPPSACQRAPPESPLWVWGSLAASNALPK